MSLMTERAASSITPVLDAARELVCERLAWDSQFFGFNIGRLWGNRLTPERAREAVRWCRDHAIRCLYFLADADDPATNQNAADAGFRMVDVRCTYECELPSWHPAVDSPAVRPYEPADLSAIERIAAANHTDSRFYFDSHFSRERCDELFAGWIRRSCAGLADAVFVAGFAGSPAGYITCHAGDGGRGSIGLFGVHPAFRGHGLGQQLAAVALKHLRSLGIQRVEVVTHGRNVRSQQMCQRSGFVIGSLELWYHLWPAAVT
jgi:dTDP-4-amino-4,6-dideoxy-D-galactose acyltransferase